MVKYNDFLELTSAFASGKFRLSNKFAVNGVNYKILNSSEHNFKDVLTSKNSVVIYCVNGNEDREAVKKIEGLDDWLVFIWKPTKHLHVVPITIKATSKARAISVQANEGVAPTGVVIGDEVNITFNNFGDEAVPAKVDTGADVCSIHADSWKIQENGNITLTNSVMSPNDITLKLVDTMAVNSSDGGKENRPIIALSITINDIVIKEALFNVNDRANMKHKILIGQNVLKKGKFLIDPSADKPLTSEEWEQLQSSIETLTESEMNIHTATVNTLKSLITELSETHE